MHGVAMVATPTRDANYRDCVPLLTLKAAAGAFGGPQDVEPEDWVVPDTSRRLGPGMFVAQVVGRSMEPLIPNGSWCLFRSPVEGSRQGRGRSCSSSTATSTTPRPAGATR
jgi:hypothetical protein